MAILIFFEAQMFFRMTKAAQALPILAVTSQSVTPCLSVMLPRYTKDSTSLICSLFTVTGMLTMVLIFINSVFFLLTLSPVAAHVVDRCVVLSCIWLQSSERSTRSSAKSRSSNCI